MKRLVLFVEGEGEGESDSVPILVKRLLSAQAEAWSVVSLDPDTFRVGQVNKLVKENFREWKRKLAASLKRSNVGGILLLLDGDVRKVGNETFCAAKVAKALASEAKTIGAGVTFSVGVVFARQEFESWLLAGVESLAGKRMPDGRSIAKNAKAPAGNLDENPRDAKGELSRFLEDGYKQTRDQAALTTLIDLEAVRTRQLRSFRRLESAISTLVTAIRTNKHVASPS